MSATPFELVHLRDKQRKKNILNSIEQKDLKRRSISYSFKFAPQKQNDDNEKEKKNEGRQSSRDQNNRIKINNSLKKSFFYRKILNRSIDTHMTTQEFQRFKDRFDSANRQQYIGGNKSVYFRNIC